MKVCFFGLGSIGKRHLKNYIDLSSKLGLEKEIHVFRSSNKELEDSLKVHVKKIITDKDDIEDGYDIVFITNPTSIHYDTIKLMVDKTRHMFIEKPVFDKLDYDIRDLGLKAEGVYYVARPLVHSQLIQTIKALIEDEEVYSVRSICSSYLPDWRPNQDYRTVYSAKKDLGGGVSIDLIHEWDYLTYLFGFPTRVYNLQGKFSDLEIDSEDLSIYIGAYPDKLVEVHLDYFGRETRREIEIITRTATIRGDFIKKNISFSDDRQTIVLKDRDMYKSEMEYFIDLVLNDKACMENVYRAYRVLKLTMGRV